MKTLKAAFLAAGLAIAAALPAHAGQYAGPGFSGELWIGGGGSPLQRAGPIYLDETGLRIERSLLGGPLVVSLVTWDSIVAYNLRPDLGVYWTGPNESGASFGDGPCTGYESGEKLGLETVNGRNTEKWRCTGQLRAPSGVPTDSTRWFDRELNVWVRQVEDRGAIQEIRNIETGRQDPSLFEVPAGFEMVDG